MDFTHFLGQPALTERLLVPLQQGRVAHALIFLGPSGSGRRTAAALYARALLCRSDTEKPCNHCSSCSQVLAQSHPDLHVLRPAEPGKSLGVEDARGLMRQMDMKPYEGGRVVAIVEDAHALTPQAQNALLKTLEEPPAHAVFLLLAETLSSLLPTVLSRCSVVKLAKLSTQDVMAVLMKRGGASPADERTQHAAAIADGSPGRALALLADEDYWPLREDALRVLDTLAAGGGLAQAMKFLQERRARIDDVLLLWECALRDGRLRQVGSRADSLSGAPRKALLALSGERLEQMLTACAAARRALDGNAIYTVATDRLLLHLSGG